MTGDPDKEYGTNKPPPTGRVRERSKGDQSWVFLGRTDVEAEISILWPPDTKS